MYTGYTGQYPMYTYISSLQEPRHNRRNPTWENWVPYIFLHAGKSHPELLSSRIAAVQGPGSFPET